jgi:salicylate 1-O-methyltransferase
MPESSIVVRPEPVGSPRYTESSRLQAAGLPEATALFEQCAAQVPLPRAPQPVVLADYGAATGHNSLVPMGSAIRTLRGRTRSEHAVLVVHTDIADNDFTALFQTLADDPDSYLNKDAATFASAVGRSFYRQILPSNSVTLGWSSWACQWLSRSPTPIPDHIQAACSADADVRAAYARQAAHDWHEFVAFRGRELCPGGRMVVLTLAVDEDGEFGFRPLLDATVAGLDALCADGVITADELAAMSIPVVGRSVKDFGVPFAPRDRFEDLMIEQVQVFHGEDRAWTRYQADQDASAFGAHWAALAGASVFPALAATVDQARRPEFLSRLHGHVATALAAAPQHIVIPLATVVLAKVTPSR